MHVLAARHAHARTQVVLLSGEKLPIHLDQREPPVIRVAQKLGHDPAVAGRSGQARIEDRPWIERKVPALGDHQRHRVVKVGLHRRNLHRPRPSADRNAFLFRRMRPEAAAGERHDGGHEPETDSHVHHAVPPPTPRLRSHFRTQLERTTNRLRAGASPRSRWCRCWHP